jgi:hypothetical protein
MNHVVLLGDSIFDHAASVAGRLDVRSQLQQRLPHHWRVTLLAVEAIGPQTWPGPSTSCLPVPATWW